MKKVINTSLCSKTIFNLLLIIVLFLSNCSKNKTEINTTDNQGVKIMFKVEGISSKNAFDPIKKSSTTNNANEYITNNRENGNITTIIDNNVGFTLDATSIQTTINGVNNITKNKVKYDIKPIAATSPMANGTTYRILIYKNNIPQLWKTVHATAGQAINIDVSKGDTYKWFAYSYNDTQIIPEPSNTQSPKINAPVDKDLLYNKGEILIPITAAGQNHIYPINFIFQHKMAEIKVRIDATTLAQYATINGIKAQFSQNNYIKSGIFDVKNDVMESTTVVPTSQIFNTSSPNPTNIWETSYFTADPASLTSYKVKITDLPVTFSTVNPTIADVNLATFSSSTVPVPNVEQTFTFTNPQFGHTLLAAFNLSYTFPSRRILHVACDCIYGYAMERGGGWAVINDTRNFGTLPESLVRMTPYATGQGVWKGGNLTNAGTANATGSNYLLPSITLLGGQQTIINRLKSTDTNVQPDIVIFGHDMYSPTIELQDAIAEYVNNGGIFIMMYERTYDLGKNLIAKIFNVTNTTLTMQTLGGAGSMYKILNVDDPVANGPFGDVRGKHWGEDASITVGVIGLPTNDIVVYSYGLPVNYIQTSANAAWANIPSMFRHKTKNFFYLGDGGLTSFFANNNISLIDVPFRYNPATGRPIPKPYGFEGNGYSPGSEGAYNSIIAGNIMLWAAELAEFKGIKPWRYKAN